MLRIATLLSVCLGFCFPCAAAPEKEEKPGPKLEIIATREAVLKRVEVEYRKSPVASLGGRDRDVTDQISVAEVRSHGLQLLAAWYCPTSGEASCQVYVYVFDAKRRGWKSLKEHHFHGTQDVSVELTTERKLILRDVEHKEILAEEIKVED